MALLYFGSMLNVPSSLFCTNELSVAQIESIFQRADFFKKSWAYNKTFESEDLQDKTVLLAFLEPSTRTRLSFEMAAQRLKMRVLTLGDLDQTSMQKGESFFETFKTISQLHPDLVIMRWKSPMTLWQQVQELNISLINAGAGVESHPTQALLDAYTMRENFGQISGLKVLFYGDIRHSRVFSSNLKLLTRWGAQVGVCSPDEFLATDEQMNAVERIHDFRQALAWCDVVVGLRAQKERFSANFDLDDLIKNYQLNTSHLSLLKKEAIIMHPGPFNLGVELTAEVLNDTRIRIYNQVENGVYIRAALMELLIR